MPRREEIMICDLRRRNGELRDELERVDPDNKYLTMPTTGRSIRYNLVEELVFSAIGWSEGAASEEDLRDAVRSLETYWLAAWRVASESSKRMLEVHRKRNDVDD